MRSVLPVLLAASAFLSCATVKTGDLDELKPAIERINTRMRWKDFRGASDLLVPERRAAFIKARTRLKDEKDLFISNYELEDATVAPDSLSAKAVSHMSWYRLPSTTEQTVTINSVYVWREGTWLLESQDDGPFEELKPAPETPKATDPKPGAALPK